MFSAPVNTRHQKEALKFVSKRTAKNIMLAQNLYFKEVLERPLYTLAEAVSYEFFHGDASNIFLRYCLGAAVPGDTELFHHSLQTLKNHIKSVHGASVDVQARRFLRDHDDLIENPYSPKALSYLRGMAAVEAVCVRLAENGDMLFFLSKSDIADDLSLWRKLYPDHKFFKTKKPRLSTGFSQRRKKCHFSQEG